MKIGGVIKEQKEGSLGKLSHFRRASTRHLWKIRQTFHGHVEVKNDPVTSPMMTMLALTSSANGT